MSDLLSRLSLQPVGSSDFEAMLALRIDAMRPSLERVGRFDAARSRERLSAGFVVPYMHHIVLDGDLADWDGVPYTFQTPFRSGSASNGQTPTAFREFQTWTNSGPIQPRAVKSFRRVLSYFVWKDGDEM